MALFSLPPASPQSDLNLQMFLGNGEAEESHFQMTRTLAPEWALQSGVQLTWPHAQTDWAPMLAEVTECYLRLAYEIATRETLLIVAPDVIAVKQLIDQRLPSRAANHIIYHECPTNDTWARDHGFLTVMTTDGPELLDFRFNGWGGKFEASLDNAINHSLVAGEHPVLMVSTLIVLTLNLKGEASRWMDKELCSPPHNVYSIPIATHNLIASTKKSCSSSGSVWSAFSGSTMDTLRAMIPILTLTPWLVSVRVIP